MNKIKNKRMSEYIGDDYKRWDKEYVVFDAATGIGKTYFCINVLGEYARKQRKKILYLCNRIELKSQISKNVNKAQLDSVITVMLYQQLDKMCIEKTPPRKFDYIVSDECHYFFSDAFNNYTDYSFDYIANAVDESVVIYMSATAKFFFKVLKKYKNVPKRNIYEIENSYGYINKLYFYKEDEIYSIIDRIIEKTHDNKMVVFCNTIHRMRELYEKYEDISSCICSRNTKDYWAIKHSNPDAIQRGTFESRILFTTSVLYNGVDLKDRKIQCIFSELVDLDSLLQSLGRKRPKDKDDKIHVFVREYTKAGLQGYINSNNKDLKAGKVYKKDPEAFIHKQYTNRSFYSEYGIFYQGFRDIAPYDIMMNKLQFARCQMNAKRYKEIQEKGYLSVVVDELGESIKPKVMSSVNNIKERKNLMLALETNCNEKTRLYKNQRIEYMELINKCGGNVKNNGVVSFNTALKKIFPIEQKQYEFVNKENGKTLVEKGSNPQRDKTYWLIKEKG